MRTQRTGAAGGAMQPCNPAAQRSTQAAITETLSPLHSTLR